MILPAHRLALPHQAYLRCAGPARAPKRCSKEFGLAGPGI